MGAHFAIHNACQYGTLPKVSQWLAENNKEEAKSLLRSYTTTYIKEEIQAEALTRNVGAFQRFLPVAVQGNAQVIEFANISRECSVPIHHRERILLHPGRYPAGRFLVALGPQRTEEGPP